MNIQTQRLFQEAQKFHQKGQIKEALTRYERTLTLAPKFSVARIFLALTYQQLGKPHEAWTHAEQARKDMGKPDLAVLVNYGIICKNLGKLNDAAESYELALEIAPDLGTAKANLATIYFMQGRLDEAQGMFEDLAQKMDEAAPWLNLARIALLKDLPEDARRYLEKADDLDPTHPDVAMLGARAAHLEKDDETAYTLCVKAIKRHPAHRESWLQLQLLDSKVYNLEELGRLLQSVANANIQSATILSIVVDLARKHWIWRPLPELESLLSKSLKNPLDKVPTASDSFTLLGANVTQEDHLSVATRCWQALTQTYVKLAKPFPRPLSGRKLKVAFLSSDLRGHAIGYLAVGFFESLPKEHIEWWAYSNAADDGSAVHGRLRDNFDRRIAIFKMSDEELAQKIRDDGIDVLIDLNQMTALTRANVMAHRPAPLQIQWLGMPGTLGAGDDVDYIIVDEWGVNADNATGFSEALLMLPRSYQPNDHVRPDLSKSESRTAAGLPEDKVIFGVFNQHYKFSPDTFSLWGEILGRVPDAVLWLLAPSSSQLKDVILEQGRQHGIDATRIIFAESKSHVEHLARLQWMDLVLDTWPYNAHTTCSDALRAGVPVLTLPKGTFASRVAAGILDTVGLNEWIANTSIEYVEKAIAFGLSGRDEIDAVKRKVSDQYWASPMVDNQALGKMFETALLGIFERFERGLAPTSLKLVDTSAMARLNFGRQADDAAGLETVDAQDVSKNVSSSVDAVPLSGAIGSKNAESDEGRYQWEKSIERGGKKARTQNLSIFKSGILKMTEIPLVIDLYSGTESTGGYELLADVGLARLIGFKSSAEGFEKLLNTENRSYVLQVIGDGRVHDFHVCSESSMSSILSPNSRWLSIFPGFENWSTVVKTYPVSTKRLDEITEIKGARFARLDAQGAETLALENGISLLKELSILQVRSSPTPLYAGEPSFFELGQWLREQGFVLHALNNENKRCFKPFGTEESPYSGKRQVVQLDAIFIPDPVAWDLLSAERLLALAFMAHALYRSSDVSMRALEVLDRRDGGQRVEAFRQYLETASLDA